MYEQSLYSIEKDHIKPKVLKRMNRLNKWDYGYNKEHDIVVISKTGKIGEIYNIQNLLIALPLAEDIYKCSDKKEEQRWKVLEYPKELSKVKTVYEWNEKPLSFKEKYYDYINKEFVRREEGFWYYNKGIPTYITGTHYMYLQWTKIDVGHADFRESNRLFHIFWEACKSDSRSYGMCYLKNRRFHPTQLTRQQYREILGLEYSLSRELTLRRCSRIRLYPYRLITHSFSNRYRTGWNVPKQNYRTKSHLNVSRAIRSKRQTKIYKRDWIRPSIGRIPETTRTTERNSNYSSTMNRVNGRDRTTSSTTGGSRKQR